MANSYFCGDSSVLRFANDDRSEWVCLPLVEEMKITPLLQCVDECGNLVSCLSPVAPVVLAGDADAAREFLKKAVPLECSKIHFDWWHASIGRGSAHAANAGMDTQETETAISEYTPVYL